MWYNPLAYIITLHEGEGKRGKIAGRRGQMCETSPGERNNKIIV